MENIYILKEVGVINKRVIELLGLDIEENSPIYIGESNINHIRKKHYSDYVKYGEDLSLIISNPTFVGIGSDNSIEYVKEYIVDGNFVKVAVRVALSGKFYVRSMYSLNNNRVTNFIKKGTLVKY